MLPGCVAISNKDTRTDLLFTSCCSVQYSSLFAGVFGTLHQVVRCLCRLSLNPVCVDGAEYAKEHTSDISRASVNHCPETCICGLLLNRISLPTVNLTFCKLIVTFYGPAGGSSCVRIMSSM